MRNLLTAFFLITMVSCTSVQIRHKTSVPEFTGPGGFIKEGTTVDEDNE